MNGQWTETRNTGYKTHNVYKESKNTTQKTNKRSNTDPTQTKTEDEPRSSIGLLLIMDMQFVYYKSWTGYILLVNI